MKRFPTTILAVICLSAIVGCKPCSKCSMKEEEIQSLVTKYEAEIKSKEAELAIKEKEVDVLMDKYLELDAKLQATLKGKEQADEDAAK